MLSVPNRPQRSKDEHNTDSLFLLQFYSAAGRCMGHEAPRARQKQITFPHPKASFQGVSHWMEETGGIKLIIALSES